MNLVVSLSRVDPVVGSGAEQCFVFERVFLEVQYKEVDHRLLLSDR